MTTIRNFRPVAGLRNNGGAAAIIFRCGSTDGLGAKIRKSKDDSSSNGILQQQHQYPNPSWSQAEWFVFRDAGLILDLRSSPERKEADARLWMDEASSSSLSQRRRPIRVLTIPVSRGSTTDPQTELLFGKGGDASILKFRYVMRLDVLNRAELLGYARDRWLSSATKKPQSSAKKSLRELMTGDANAIMDELNQRGLAGLNEAILETQSGRTGMRLALQIMTLYQEAIARTVGADAALASAQERTIPKKPSGIVFHCVQGKDRTGMLAMLIQLLLKCPDEVIVEDYYRSNAEFEVGKTSPSSSESSAAAAALVATSGQNHRTHGSSVEGRRRMDKSVFSGTNRPAMVATLKGLRQRHRGRYLEGYFDEIGFDVVWRKRFVAAFGKNGDDHDDYDTAATRNTVSSRL